MPINVIGSTDTTGALSVIPNGVKTICIIGDKGVGPSVGEKTLFDIYSVPDADAKFGTGTQSAKLVDVLIRNGVTSVKGIMIDSAQVAIADKYDKALDELMKDQSIKIIIVDTTDATVATKVKAHLDVMDAENVFRYAVLGADAGTDNATLTTKATAINNKRVFFAGPTVLDTTGAALSGIFAAAGLAAEIAVETKDPALPMNGVEISGFGGVERVLLSSEKDALVNGGVVPLYNSSSGNPTIHRLVTTYTTDEVWKEGTTVFIADDVLSAVRNRILTNYKRTKNVARILKSIRTDVIDVLQTKNDLEIIENFDPKTVSVIKDPNDLYGALIDYEFDVVTPLYTITINQHMKL